MLAKRARTILPPLEEEEVLEVSKIYSVAGELKDSLIRERPFRSPHHSASVAAIVGGGNPPRPGEISLSHKGILFLDELPEFGKKTLEALRQPLEDKKVLISRSSFRVVFPADFMLLCAMNPCPCGNYKNPYKPCTCTRKQIKNYLLKVSGPLLDRIDIKVWMNPVEEEQLLKQSAGESSSKIRERVEVAFKIQKERQKKFNSNLSDTEIKKFCTLTRGAKAVLKDFLKSSYLSARSFKKVLKVSRTIADLCQESNIDEEHIYLALQLSSQELCI